MKYRDTRGAVATVDTQNHEVVIEAPVYNVVDSYRTIWNPGVFTESIERRAPSLVWSHDWRDPIGYFKDADEKPDRLSVQYGLDDFDAVPRAKQAFAQFRSGTLRDASFGFDDDEQEPEKDKDGVFRIMRASLQEHSPVLVGAVPGAKIAGVRQVNAVEVLRLARELEQGSMTLEEALAAVARAAESGETRAMHQHAKQDGSGTMQHSHAEQGGSHAHSGLLPAFALNMGRGAEPTTPAHPVADEQRADMVTCPDCGAENPADATTCEKCGADLPDAARALLVSEARAILKEVETR